MRSRAGTIACFAVLAVVSGLLALAGEPWGFLGLLFFGGLGAVYWFLTAPPRQPSEPGGPYGTPALPEERVYPGKPGAMVAVTIGAAIFVVAGAWLVVVGLDPAVELPRRMASPVAVGIGAVSIAFFGLCGIIGVGSLLGRRRGITLFREGVLFRAPAGRAWVRWENLDSVHVGSDLSQSYVALRARSPEAVELGGLNRWLRRLNRRWFGMDVGYPGNFLRADPKIVVSEIRHYWLDPRAREDLPERGA